jgi:hypothetical protein
MIRRGNGGRIETSPLTLSRASIRGPGSTAAWYRAAQHLNRSLTLRFVLVLRYWS